MAAHKSLASRKIENIKVWILPFKLTFSILQSVARKGIKWNFIFFGFEGLLQGSYLLGKLQSTVCTGKIR